MKESLKNLQAECKVEQRLQSLSKDGPESGTESESSNLDLSGSVSRLSHFMKARLKQVQEENEEADRQEAKADSVAHVSSDSLNEVDDVDVENGLTSSVDLRSRTSAHVHTEPETSRTSSETAYCNVNGSVYAECSTATTEQVDPELCTASKREESAQPTSSSDLLKDSRCFLCGRTVDPEAATAAGRVRTNSATDTGVDSSQSSVSDCVGMCAVCARDRTLGRKGGGRNSGSGSDSMVDSSLRLFKSPGREESGGECDSTNVGFEGTRRIGTPEGLVLCSSSESDKDVDLRQVSSGEEAVLPADTMDHPGPAPQPDTPSVPSAGFDTQSAAEPLSSSSGSSNMNCSTISNSASSSAVGGPSSSELAWSSICQAAVGTSELDSGSQSTAVPTVVTQEGEEGVDSTQGLPASQRKEEGELDSSVSDLEKEALVAVLLGSSEAEAQGSGPLEESEKEEGEITDDETEEETGVKHKAAEPACSTTIVASPTTSSVTTTAPATSDAANPTNSISSSSPEPSASGKPGSEQEMVVIGGLKYSLSQLQDQAVFSPSSLGSSLVQNKILANKTRTEDREPTKGSGEKNEQEPAKADQEGLPAAYRLSSTSSKRRTVVASTSSSSGSVTRGSLSVNTGRQSPCSPLPDTSPADSSSSHRSRQLSGDSPVNTTFDSQISSTAAMEPGEDGSCKTSPVCGGKSDSTGQSPSSSTSKVNPTKKKVN